MSVIEALRVLAAGNPVPGGTLLQTCRLSALGADFYGEEDVIELFRRAPLGSDPPEAVSAAGHAALLWPDKALVADISGQHVARLWRLGPGEPALREPALAVPFDPDMAENPQAVQFEPGDHPSLDTPFAEAVRNAGERLSREWTLPDGTPPSRARPFAIRAFSDADRTVALFAVHVLGGRGERHAGFVHASAHIRDGETALVLDLSGAHALIAAPWLPSIR